MIGLIGKKREMTQLFEEDGTVVPVTLIEAKPCVVTQVKTEEKDGYSAVQLGVGQKRNVSKPIKGHLRKGKLETVKYLIEFRVSDPENYSEGQLLDVKIFSEGEIIDVSSFSKGKGFQGVVKRHGYSGGPETHGSTSHRVPGSLGASATPGRVVKGKKLPGRMGGNRVTVKNLKIAKVEQGENIIAVKGAIPGSRNSIIILRKKRNKKKKGEK
ncbi:50S ribosomal protein L3 [candidate division WOR-3 bacterium]|nr:50S ribosomal protein L3 [candidate division WOR-3 bacterium]MCK4575213.1 50S ribosomal protein L3 [candidate division WOR-3 bacterium]